MLWRAVAGARACPGRRPRAEVRSGGAHPSARPCSADHAAGCLARGLAGRTEHAGPECERCADCGGAWRACRLVAGILEPELDSRLRDGFSLGITILALEEKTEDTV